MFAAGRWNIGSFYVSLIVLNCMLLFNNDKPITVTFKIAVWSIKCHWSDPSIPHPANSTFIEYWLLASYTYTHSPQNTERENQSVSAVFMYSIAQLFQLFISKILLKPRLNQTYFIFSFVSLTVVQCLGLNHPQTAATPPPAPGSTSSHTWRKTPACENGNSSFIGDSDSCETPLRSPPAVTQPVFHRVLWCDPSSLVMNFNYGTSFFSRIIQLWTRLHPTSRLPLLCTSITNVCAIIWEKRKNFFISLCSVQPGKHKTKQAPLTLSLEVSFLK